jgi:hypothetical protein
MLGSSRGVAIEQISCSYFFSHRWNQFSEIALNSINRAAILLSKIDHSRPADGTSSPAASGLSSAPAGESGMVFRRDTADSPASGAKAATEGASVRAAAYSSAMP